MVVQTDSSIVGRELQPGTLNRSLCFPLRTDIKQTLSALMSHQISVVGRKSNALAHELGALARNSGDYLMIANVPSSLCQLMISDYKHTSE